MLKSKFFEINENQIYDVINKKLIIGNRYCNLAKSEAELLELFLLSKGTLVTIAKIEKYSSSFRGKSVFYIRAVISRLRKKLGKETIITIQKVGYKFVNIKMHQECC